MEPHSLEKHDLNKVFLHLMDCVSEVDKFDDQDVVVSRECCR